jgi:predicted site-specific integrase-resolvase
MQPDKPLIGTAEATEILGVSWDTLIRMVAKGEVRMVQKIDGPKGAYIFERAEVERAKAAGQAKAAEATA